MRRRRRRRSRRGRITKRRRRRRKRTTFNVGRMLLNNPHASAYSSSVYRCEADALTIFTSVISCTSALISISAGQKVGLARNRRRMRRARTWREGR